MRNQLRKIVKKQTNKQRSKDIINTPLFASVHMSQDIKNIRESEKKSYLSNDKEQQSISIKTSMLKVPPRRKSMEISRKSFDKQYKRSRNKNMESYGS